MGMTDIVVENEALFGRFRGRLNSYAKNNYRGIGRNHPGRRRGRLLDNVRWERRRVLQ